MRGMRIADFALERYFARWEFAVRHVLCASDVEGFPMGELLALADDETRALWASLRLGYTESTGHPLLRREIAGLYDSAEPDDVIVFARAEEAIFCLMNVLSGQDDHVIVTWPGYQSLYEVARATGAQVALHALREADGWALDVDRLVRAIRPTTRLVVVNAPHNPTGMLPTPTEWRTLVDACAAGGLHLPIPPPRVGTARSTDATLPCAIASPSSVDVNDLPTDHEVHFEVSLAPPK